MEITELNDNQNIIDENFQNVYIVNISGDKNILTKEGPLKDIKLDKVKKVGNSCLILFSTHTIPENGWSNLIGNYPDSIWIVDEYCERTCDRNSKRLEYVQSTIYRSHKDKILSDHYNFEDLDVLLELYPVHFGNIRIEELKSEIQHLKTKVIKVENNLNTKRGEMSKGSIQQWETYSYIQRNKITRNVSEIRFIMSLWEHLNDELYGYDDKDLSMRYRGIDEFAPITDISTNNRI